MSRYVLAVVATLVLGLQSSASAQVESFSLGNVGPRYSTTRYEQIGSDRTTLDVYYLTATSRMTISAYLTPTGGDLDLFLYRYVNGKWVVVQSSSNQGIWAVESVSASVAPGSYAICVSPKLVSGRGGYALRVFTR